MPLRAERLVPFGVFLAVLAPLAGAPARGQPSGGGYDEVTCLTTGVGCRPGEEKAAPQGQEEAPPPAPAGERVLVPPAPGMAAAIAPGTQAEVVAAPAATAPPAGDDGFDTPVKQRTMHGFRLGYMFVNDFDRRLEPDDPETSLKEGAGMKSPHLFLIGYEVTRRLVGHSWLNLILVGNVTVGGLEQSKFYPSANALIGFEFEEAFQIGVGPNLTPDPEKVAHIIFAGGWTPAVGSFRVPVHGFYIPDVDGVWRTGATVGVNW
jgi:hypothetical protein